MVDAPILPEYPKVMVEGTEVIIHYENGEKEVWGYEPDRKIADKTAKEIELGLQSINFVSLELLKTLNELSEQLEALGIPPEFVSDYICEGYRKVLKWFNALNTIWDPTK